MSDPRTILVVDDEPDVSGYLEMILQDGGYRTRIARDGAEALEMARAEPPDLITLDISMPKASGTRLYRDLRADPELRHVPVVIVTAVTGFGGDPYGYDKFIRHSHLVPPPDGFFPKPIEREAFLKAVEELLTRVPTGS